MFYSVMDETDTPCDVSAWTERHEITHAHHDPRMWKDGVLNGEAKYGFAQYPMKDGAGNLILNNAVSKLTYPWMDKAGDNIFFTSVASTLFYSHGGVFQARYPASCYTSQDCFATPQNNDVKSVDTEPPLRGIGVFGSWTHGKVLLVDNLNNNIDYGTGWGDNQQYWLSLYSGSGANSKVRIGGAGFVTSGKFPGPGGLPLASTYPYVYIIDSTENLFNDIPAMVPSTIRDVAWYVNLGKGTDKVVFDEWLNPDVLVYSEWIPALIHTDTSVAGGAQPNGQMHYRDGFASTRRNSVVGTGFGEPIWFQNDATGLKYKVAPYGLAKKGKNANELIRAEPVAQGGVHGRGLWLFDYNNVTYEIPAQDSGVDIGNAWYVGLYVDYAAKASDTTQRRLLTFPDGSSVRLSGSKVQFFASDSDSAVKEFDLNDVGPVGVHIDFDNESKGFSRTALGTRRWWHFGIQVVEGDTGAKVEFLVNGFRKGVWDSGDSETRLFRLVEGSLILGSPSDQVLGFRGWTDSLLVVAQDVNPELACNYANGTLVGLSGGLLQTSAVSYYPDSAHAKISRFLRTYSKPTYPGYFCLHDYTSDLDIDVRYMPSGVVSIRENIIFPEGPLVVGQSRPDTRSNKFCLSCHTSATNTDELTVAVLNSVSDPVETDTRRQPAQGPRLIRGNIPAHHMDLDWNRQDVSLNKGFALVTDLWTLDSKIESIDRQGMDVSSDSDADGVANKNDRFPADTNRSKDLDGDRIDDLTDDDLDGDGVLNCVDAFPNDAGEWADTDGDGTGDNWDVDADDDGVMDPIYSHFHAPGPRLTERTVLNAEWELIDPEQAGDGDHYAGGYTIKRDWAGSPDTGISHPMLQGGFAASVSFARVGDSKGAALIYWRFEDSGSSMQVEYHTGSSTLVAAIRRPGSNRFESFGSRVITLPRASLNGARRLRVDVHWTASQNGGPGSGSWYVAAGLNGEALAEIGTTSVTTDSNSSDSRTMSFAITGNTTEYVWLDHLSLEPRSIGGPTVSNGGFENLGASVHGPISNVDGWTIVSDPSVIGGLSNPQNFGFARGGTDNGLFVGVDFVNNRSTTGKIYQDVGNTTSGVTYSLSAAVYAESTWPAGYKLSMRDATTDVELASVSDSLGEVSVEFTETESRTLRVQIESNGSVTAGSARRTLLDDVEIVASNLPVPAGPQPKPADQTCPRPPGAPQDLTATPGDGEITFAWSVPEDEGKPPFTEYDIRLFPEGAVGLWQSQPATTTTYTVRQLASDLQQTFEVRARNSEGAGPSASVNVPAPAPENQPPTFTNAPDLVTVQENSTAVITVSAEDPDEEDVVTAYRIGGGDDGTLFSITNEGVLAFVAAPDYEDPKDTDGDNNYHVDVVADSGEGDRSASATHALTVFVQDVADGFASAGEVCFFGAADWRASDGSFRTCIGESAYNFSAEHNDAVSAISVGAGVHAIIFADRDYQGDSKCVGSGINDNNLGALDNAASSFKVIAGDCPDAAPENQPPTFTNAPDLVTVQENSTAVTTLSAEDSDTEDAVTGYRIGGGDDGALFSITSDGVLTFIAPPDYESPQDADVNNNYLVDVTVESGAGDRAASATHSMTVGVQDVPDGFAEAGEVCFFESADWRVEGSSFRACIGESAYNFNAQHNDRVSAVSVGADVHAIIYTDRDYQGASMCIESGTNVNDLGALDNAASSFKVVAGGCPK